MIVATDLSRTPLGLNNPPLLHHIKTTDNQFMTASAVACLTATKNQFNPQQQQQSHQPPPPPEMLSNFNYSSSHLKSIMDLSGNDSQGHHQQQQQQQQFQEQQQHLNYMRNLKESNKYFLDANYRNYCKNIQEIQSNASLGLAKMFSSPSKDYDDAMSASQSGGMIQSSNNEDSTDLTDLSPNHSNKNVMNGSSSVNDGSGNDATDYHYLQSHSAQSLNSGGGDAAEKSIKANNYGYVKNFDTIRARQLDEMQNNCDMNNHEIGSGNNNNNNGNKLGSVDECSSSEMRNYASSDDLNQTMSSERDDKIGSGSDDEGKAVLKIFFRLP